ncbi:hypothetical protein HZS_2367 [Henneguya salminicola]|nr:hypothetical protein HZS_2367 [Henneguya salminicola]
MPSICTPHAFTASWLAKMSTYIVNHPASGVQLEAYNRNNGFRKGPNFCSHSLIPRESCSWMLFSLQTSFTSQVEKISCFINKLSYHFVKNGVAYNY